MNAAATFAAIVVAGLAGGAAGGFAGAIVVPVTLPQPPVAAAAPAPEALPSHSVTYYVAHLPEARRALDLCEARLLNTTHRGCHNADKALYLSGER